MTEEGIQGLFSRLKKQGALPHCILLQGSDEVFLFDIASLIAKIILCIGEKRESFPCNICPSCIKHNAKTHADLKVIEGEGKTMSISVDKIRKVKEDAHVIPIESERKVYIIRNSQNMTIQAQNAVLKILEEPPNGVHFILICKKADDMLPTILSRVQVFTIDEKDKKYDKNEVTELAKNLIGDIIKSRYGEILLLSEKFIKDKNFFNEFLLALEKTVRDIIKCNFTGKTSGEDLSQYDNEKMLKLYDIVSITIDKMEINANQKLFITHFCSQLLNL